MDTKIRSTKAYTIRNIFNCWTVPILLRQKQRELQTEDVPPISSVAGGSEAHVLGSSIAKLWREQPTGKRKLWNALLQKFGTLFLTFVVLLLFQQCVLRLALPVLLGLLIRFLNEHCESTLGFAFAASFGLIIFLSTLIFHPCIFGLQKMGMRLRVGVTNLIYEKVLRLSQKSVSQSGIGQLTNILSNDVNRFDDVMEFVPFVIVGPCQIVAVTIILWKYLGPSCLTGLGLLLILMPVQGLLGKKFGRLRQSVAQITDRRVRCLTELLSGMLLIKMSAWEDFYAEAISNIRKSELSLIQTKNRFFGLNHILFTSSTKISILLTFLSFVLTDHDLTPETLFVTMSMYNTIALTIGNFLPAGISGLSEMVVSIARIQNILLLDEKQCPDEAADGIAKNADLSPLVLLKNVTGSWGNVGDTLKNISIKAGSGDLIGIIGPVGSGKSSILQAILHELPLSDPNSVRVRGSIGYASQDPFLFPESIRNNILFGQTYDAAWYAKVIDACALTSDFALFPFGDETLVGDKGVALSGGQKARVNLARAVYSRADIYLLDDPLSALDVRVARHVKENCIDGLLAHACVVLVTHQTHFLRNRVREVICVEGGQIVHRGSYETVFDGIDTMAVDDISEPSPSGVVISDIKMDDQTGTTETTTESFTIEENGEKVKPKAEAELRRQGSVGWSLFFTYSKTGNSYCKLFVVLFFILFAQFLQNGSDIWLKIWAEKEERHAETNNATDFFFFLPELPHHLEYVEVYALLVALFVYASLTRVLMVFGTLLSSGAKLHEDLFLSILRAPMSFFQVNSEGLILKLFSNDIGVMDDRLPNLTFQVIGTTLQFLGSMTLVSLMSPVLVVPTVILILVIYFILRVYITSSGSLKRIEGIDRSPIFGHLTTTLSGLSTIRAFKAQSYFSKSFVHLQDEHTSAFFLYLASFRWITMTLELVSDLYINVVMIYLLSTSADSAALGLALTAALCLINDGTGMIMFSAQLINQMISAERIIDYAQIEPEEQPGDYSNIVVPADWPDTGEMAFAKVQVAYKNGPNILENIDLSIRDGEKIGIIGRTGAGKSSLVAALFRIVNPSGEIRISKMPTRNIPLKTLRRNLSIIPQNPVLLAGTLRRNLDPFSEYSDDTLWEALDTVQLKSKVSQSGQGLSYEVCEGGLNFSQGERQLISLARTIVKRNKILVLDEATANIDTTTDGIIQNALRERFQHSTVMTIAHRLETVMDSDRILVLDGGRVREFESPAALLSNQNSFLFQLVQKTGTKNAQNLMKMVRKTK